MISCIQKELIARKNEIKNQPIETIYFGGGTPSLLTVADLEKLIQTVHSEFTCAENVECTLEANPDDITFQQVAAWKSAGINRLSVGIQSFDSEDLFSRRRIKLYSYCATGRHRKYQLGFNLWFAKHGQ